MEREISNGSEDTGEEESIQTKLILSSSLI
jgi:hypothetical protein